MASLNESFELIETLIDHPEGSLHRARDRRTDALVLLRRPPSGLSFEEGRRTLWQESGVLGQLASVPGVARITGMFQGTSEGALILEHFPGISLAERLKSGTPGLGLWLDWAVSLTVLLDGVHRAGFLHRDLHPASFLIDESRGEFLLVGLGHAAPAAEDRRAEGNPDRVSDWAYLTPEQTGRINLPQDRRTDGYALGLVLHAMASGAPAFPVQGPLEAVHAHLAKVPPPPPGLPGPLAEILAKLLAKDPGQRYQSLTGLAADLNRCRDQWKASGRILSFALGAEDLADQLRPTRKLFGRADGQTALREAYDRTATGLWQTILISGPSGAGKSALAAEAGAWAQGEQGFFLAGQYDEIRKDQPYAALVQQIEGLARQLLRRPDLAHWRGRFSEALKDNQGVITSLAPGFEAVCGPQPAPPALPPRETENRLFYSLRTFLQALLDGGAPVVLLFDDVQWIDPASIRLLEYLGERRDTGRLLSLYVCRSADGVMADGPLAFLAKVGAASGLAPITLGPLEPGAVRSWLDEVLGAPIRDPDLLVRNLVAKTGGSPFYVERMVQQLHRDGILSYDRSARRWDWNPRTLAGLPASENVGDFLVGQLAGLPEASATLLGIASCLGGTVSSDDLGTFSDLLPDLAGALWPLIDRHYVVPLSEGYLALASPEFRGGEPEFPGFSFRFQHDRIRQAARDRQSPEFRAMVHLRAARRLEAARPAEAAGHYLQVVDQITAPGDRLHLVRLLVRVAQTARAASAGRQALDLLREAGRLSPGTGLPGSEDRQLRLLWAETAYLCHETDEGDEVSQALLASLTAPSDRAEVLQMQMDAFTFLGRMADALDRGQKALGLLGVRLALAPNPLVLASTLIRVTAKADRRRPDDLFDREGRTPDKVRTLLRLLGKFLVPAQMSGNINLFVLSTLMTADLALDHPNTDETSGAFGNFAILLSVLGRHRQAYAFAGLALRLEEARPNPKTAAGVHSAYAFFSLPWNRPWAEVPPACRRGAEAALRAGDLFFIAYQNLFATVFAPPATLEASISGLEETLALIAGTNQVDAVVGGTFALRRWQALAGTRKDPLDFSGPDFDEAKAVRAWEEKKNLSGLAVYRLYKAQVEFTLARPDAAWDQWEAGKASWGSILGSAYMEEYAVFTVLICAQKLRTPGRFPGARAALAKECRRLGSWARTCPENFAALAALAQAEEAALRGRNGAAARRFAEALRWADHYPSLHLRWKALVHERAAGFHLRSGDRALGRYLLEDAQRLYSLWGARAKVLQLEADHPGLSSRAGDAAAPRSTSLEGDAASLWKVSQAISREIDIDRLMPVVVQAVTENAGARRGWLLLRGEEGWQVVARGSSEGAALAFPAGVSPGSEGIPAVLLAAAEGADQGLLVASAVQDPRFSADPLVVSRNLKSVLGLRFSPPGSALQALWYFENDLVEGAFSPDRLGGLRLLSGQIGISLENARMYRALTDLNRDLEGKVRDRTAELEERNRQFLHSVEYAGVLQRSLLPRDWGSSVAGKVALWIPKDIVGGDLYWFRETPESCLLALVDCTGHGVPGALITVLIHSILDEAWAAAAPGDLEAVLTKANQQFRRALGQDRPGSESNDGFDIGLLWWSRNGGDLRFAGARISLLRDTGDGTAWHHGGRKGLGYPETPDRPAVEVHTVPRGSGVRFYLATDGFLGQVGGDKGISFGRDRFADLVLRTRALGPEDQERAFREAFDAYRGVRPQADDITVLGVEFP